MALEFVSGAKSMDKFGDELQGTHAELNLTRKIVQALSKDLDTLEDPRKINVQTERFDQVSRDVSLAGDTESNLRTVGGAFGAIGATGAAQGIGTIAEIPALIEALPRLKEAFVGLPDSIGAAAASVGPVGLAFAAVGVAAIALFSALSEAEQKIIEVNKQTRDSFADLTREIVAGTLTTDEINTRLADLNQQREAEQRILAAQEAEYQNYIESAGALAIGVKAVSGVEEDRIAAIEETKKRIEALNNDETGLTSARESGSVAANDAAEAERQLAQERTQGLLNEAQQAGELESLRLRAQELTAEQIQSELEGLDRKRASVEAELAVLQTSGDVSEEVTNRIKDLNDQLGFLGKQSDVLKSTTGKAEVELATVRKETTQVTKQATDTAKQATDQQKKLEQAHQQAADAQAKYTESVRNVKTAFKQAIEDIRQSFADKTTDNRIETLDALQDAEIAFNRDELSALRAHKRDLKQISQASDKAESDALRKRDFAQLAESREAEKEARKEANQEFKEEGADRLLEAQYQRDDIIQEEKRKTRDLAREIDRQARDAAIQRDRQLAAARQQLSIQEQAARQSLLGMQQYWGAFIKMQNSALSATPAGRSSGSNLSAQGIDKTLLDLTSRPQFGAT